jgi:hypothetical protein
MGVNVPLRIALVMIWSSLGLGLPLLYPAVDQPD